MLQLSDVDKQLLFEKHTEFAKKYPEYAKLMPVRENIYKLNRLEGLKYSMQMQAVKDAAEQTAEAREHLEKWAQKAYSSALGASFNGVNSNLAKSLVGAAWAGGKDFSARIWGSAEKVANYLMNDFTNGVIRGDGYSKMISQLQQRYGVSFSDAKRLIYTEGTHVMNEGAMKAFEGEYEQYKYAAIGDSHTCSVCSSLDGEIFNIKDRESGANFPPMHANCRCAFEVVIDSEAKSIGNKISTTGEKVIKPINKNSIDSVPLIKIPGYTQAQNEEIQNLHRKLLTEARAENNGMETAFIIPKKGEKRLVYGTIGDIYLGTIESSEFVMHNHPNNSSFSNRDVLWFAENDVPLFSQIGNNGKTEILIKTSGFSKEKLFIEYKRLKKKYEKLIEKDSNAGYNKITKELLKKKIHVDVLR